MTSSVSPASRRQRQAVVAMLTSCVCTALIGIFLKWSLEIDRAISPVAISFTRVALHPLVAIGPFWIHERLIERRGNSSQIATKSHSSSGTSKLWLAIWGTSGAITVVSYFITMSLLGGGLANIFSATSGLGVILLSPMVGIGRYSWSCVWGCLFAVLGTIMLNSGKIGGVTTGHGLIFGLVLAVGGSFAWLAVAKLGTSVSMVRLMQWWTGCCVLAHIILVSVMSVHWPSSSISWMAVVAAGLLTALAQILSATALRMGEASVIIVLSYLAPVLGLILEGVIWHRYPDTRMLAGIILILVSCAWLALQRKMGKTLE
jgi:drug/metabolite transporter (DMT)-like permease